MNTSEKITRIAWPIRSGFMFTDQSEILYCKAEGSYSRIYTLNGCSFIISYKLKIVATMLELLPFFRVHESYLVNLSYVNELKREDGHTYLKIGDFNLPVSKGRKKALMEVFCNLHEKSTSEHASNLNKSTV